MAKRIGTRLGALAITIASLAWGGRADPASTPVPQSAVPAGAAIAASATPFPAHPSRSMTLSPSPEGFPAQRSVQGSASPETDFSVVKPILSEAFIAQSVLRVYLNRPAAIFVYNSRGQQVCHLDSRGSVEALPLHGITTGFIYLTIRTAQSELTRKLVYTGK